MSPQAVAPAPFVDHAAVIGRSLDLDGRRFYQISAYDQMPPFFMTLVGASDLWLFISSTGGVTAGREHADRALFPYYTEDKVTESAGRTGGLSVLRVTLPDGRVVCWQPFAETRPGDPAVERNLAKDYLGTTLVFEERREDLGLRLRVSWQTSARYGVVRSCELTSVADEPRTVEVLDGFVNLLPAGATAQVQNELSALLDAYKRTEVDDATGLGILYMNSKLTDKAEPSESLRANVAWHVGLGRVDHLLSDRQVRAFAAGERVTPDTELRGERGAYLVRAQVVLGDARLVGELNRHGWLVVRRAPAPRDRRDQLRHGRGRAHRLRQQPALALRRPGHLGREPRAVLRGAVRPADARIGLRAGGRASLPRVRHDARAPRRDRRRRAEVGAAEPGRIHA